MLDNNSWRTLVPTPKPQLPLRHCRQNQGRSASGSQLPRLPPGLPLRGREAERGVSGAAAGAVTGGWKAAHLWSGAAVGYQPTAVG